MKKEKMPLGKKAFMIIGVVASAAAMAYGATGFDWAVFWANLIGGVA